MKRWVMALVLGLALGAAIDARQAAGRAGNAFYDQLCARADRFKCYSLRDPQQLVPPAQGGLLYSNSLWNPWSYDATMDAAKATVGEFAGVPSNAITAPLDPASTTATFRGVPGDYAPQVSLRIDDEVIQLETYVDPRTKIAKIQRGTRGTKAAAHDAGARTFLSTNSVKNMVWLPLGTQDGNTYFFTWDSFWTDSYRYANSGNSYYKCWQFDAGGTWVEPRLRFDGGERAGPQRSGFDLPKHIAALDFRLYHPGPNVTAAAPAAPMAGTFHAEPNRWLRHFVLIEQRANDYELLSVWAADETRGPVRLLDRLQVSLRPDGRSPNAIARFWLELDSSQDTILRRHVGLELVSFHRNFASLVNPPEAKAGGDITALLQRPVR